MTYSMDHPTTKDLLAVIGDKISDGILTDENKDEWHHLCFNEDYFIIGWYQASEWLEKMRIDSFEAVRICQEYEKDNFGECKIYDNSESTVNMLAYVLGEEILNHLNCDNLEELTLSIDNLK